MPPSPVSDPPRDVLRRDEAESRASRIRDVSYELSLDLTAGATDYTGRAVIGFELLPGEGAVWLDHTASGGEPHVSVNGKSLSGAQVGHRILLPADVEPGRVVVTVDYRHAYDHTGDGFHRFVDPEDGTE